MTASKFLTPLIFALTLLPILAYAQDAAAPSANADYIYEQPTYAKLAQLYWALSKLDPKKDTDIDNFLLINECDIYKQYRSNEFEWKDIRAKTSDFLQKSAANFPTRFELTRPIKLGEYDTDQKKFEIAPNYKLNNARSFSIIADGYGDVCGYDPRGMLNVPDYPKGVIVELSKPIILTSIAVDPDVAKNYVAQKMKAFEGLGANVQTQKNISDFRDAYLVMRLKFFAYKGEEKTPDGINNADLAANLEGLEIYADPEKRQLLYTQDYVRKKGARKGLNDIAADDGNDINLPNPNPNLTPEVDKPAATTPDAEPGKVTVPGYSPYGAPQ